MKNKKRNFAIVGLATVVGIFALTGSSCSSDADKASENISTAAEAFEVQRTLVATNGITGEVQLYVEGRCSFEYVTSMRIDVTCKYAEDDYRRHTYIKGDQDQVVISQEAGIDVSEYHSRIIIKPQNLLPEFDIMVGED